MGDLFQALTTGLARFVYAWLMPSIVTVGVFVWMAAPQVSINANVGSLGGIAAFTLAVLVLSVVFAYASRPIYQFFEGYTMPRWLARPLLIRSRRRFVRLKAASDRGLIPPRSLKGESLLAYPETVDLVLPTRLGNALRAMESYGENRFGLDSQSFWYELRAAADDDVRKGTEETRAAVDFFMSSLAHLIALSAGSIALAAFADNRAVPLAVATTAAILAPGAYAQAVRNVVEWRFATQALVNTSRPALASSLGLRLPSTYNDEMRMWSTFSGFVRHGPHDEYLRVLDPLRLPQGPRYERDAS